jgi:epoxyqueuosine reductase
VAGRLKHLAEGIRRLRPLRAARICVDSAPLPEREWAVRAGIGWLGRQGQVVRADAGCCLVLGELLVDIELEPTAQTADRCGDCRRCVAACPTQTIAPDRSVDARRCISYLTIEHKDAIPLELRPALGTALFGCDRCTAVCPWNEHGEKSELPELQPRSRPAADECLEMNAAQFRRHFKDTAVRRSGLERLQRNAAVALGNAGNLRARPLLEKTAANHPRSIVREHAAWALERLRHCG